MDTSSIYFTIDCVKNSVDDFPFLLFRPCKFPIATPTTQQSLQQSFMLFDLASRLPKKNSTQISLPVHTFARNLGFASCLENVKNIVSFKWRFDRD